ncbi:hypothetical protein Q8F55_005269 [Vanrija albida]|uniref:Uncharacterized protein n=1 Tax=Vanrija albida TaxID=181172 RepID=A0ABR3Q1W1_9TREE
MLLDIKALAGLPKHKRMTPDEIASYQSSLRAGAQKTQTPNSGVAGQPAGGKATVGTPLQPSAPATTTAGRQPPVAVQPSPSSAPNSGTPVTPQTSRTSSQTPVVATPSSSAAHTSAAPSVQSYAPPPPQSPKIITTSHSTTTARSSNTAASSASASSSASAAASNGDSSKGMSGGTIAGIVIGLLVGFIVLGALAGWAYRKYKSRNYKANNPWAKMDNDDITPFPRHNNRDFEKNSDEDFYGGAPSAAIGSNRALALARQNGFYADGSLRPDTEYGSGMAGYGAGRNYGPYPDVAPVTPVAAAYGVDANRVPSGPQYPQQQYGQLIDHGGPFDDEYAQHQQHNTSPNSGPRQLVGPGAHYQAPGPAPVPLGRPDAPETYDEIAAAELYADDRYADDELAAPRGMVPYSEGEPYTPRTAASAGEWAGAPTRGSQISYASPLPEAVSLPSPAPAPLPTLRPMSPLMPIDASAPARPPSDDDHETRRMYQEVASAAGIDQVMNPTSGLASPAPVRLPTSAPSPPFHAPYQHGQPLSPLREVPTPMSERTALPTLSSQDAHDRNVPGRTGRPLPNTPSMLIADSPSSAPTRLPPTHEEDAYGGI